MRPQRENFRKEVEEPGTEDGLNVSVSAKGFVSTEMTFEPCSFEATSAPDSLGNERHCGRWYKDVSFVRSE